MDNRPDFLNIPSHPVPQCVRCSKLPAYTTPAEAGADIFRYFKEVERKPDSYIKSLAEYMINQCDGGILESAREVVVSFFANLLETDPKTLLTSGLIHQSFAKTLGSERDYMYLGVKLTKDQALCIANSFLGKTQASNLECDTRSRGGTTSDFSFEVIKTICQMKPHYTIGNFLNYLKNSDVST